MTPHGDVEQRVVDAAGPQQAARLVEGGDAEPAPGTEGIRATAQVEGDAESGNVQQGVPSPFPLAHLTVDLGPDESEQPA